MVSSDHVGWSSIRDWVTRSTRRWKKPHFLSWQLTVYLSNNQNAGVFSSCQMSGGEIREGALDDVERYLFQSVVETNEQFLVLYENIAFWCLGSSRCSAHLLCAEHFLTNLNTQCTFSSLPTYLCPSVCTHHYTAPLSCQHAGTAKSLYYCLFITYGLVIH